MIIFIDELFVNNFDLIFQIDYVICLIDVTNKINIIHWFSIKCKRIIKNILISKLYVMIHDFDVDAIIKSTVKKILIISILFMIVCIDFKSLYECLIRLKITQKKRFMINIMCLKKVYEKREIIEIKWINEKNNSIDVMIKKNFCDVLKRFINTNIISVKTSKWIERKKLSNQFDTEIDEDFAFFINHHFSKVEFDSINLIQKSTKVLRFFINHHIRKNRFRSKSVMKFWSRSFFLYILISCFVVIFACKISRHMKFWKKIFFSKTSILSERIRNQNESNKKKDL